MSELSQRLAGLSPEKRKLLELRLRMSQGVQGAAPILPRPRGGDTAPLSFAQERLWLADQLGAGTGVYNMPHAVRLRGPLDAEALRRALHAVVARHEPLRTVFEDAEGGPVQRVLPPAPLPLPTDELDGTPEEREAEAERRMREDAARPFDLRRGPLLRAALLRLDAEEHVLLLTMHHAASDGWSMGVFFREMTAAYDALTAGREPAFAPLPITYADYAAWQREQLAGAGMERDLAWWREELEGAPAVLELPTDRPRPAVQSFRGARHPIALPAGLVERLRTLARGEEATLFMVLLAGWQLLLARWSGQDDLVVGSPVANRHRAETEGLVGFFVNTLVFRGRLEGDPTFRELLRRARRGTLGAYAHQDLPLEAILDALHVERDPARNPLFQAALVLQNAPAHRLEMRGVELDFVEQEGGTAKFDLTLEAFESADGVAGSIEYATDLFDAETVARLAGHFRVLLEGIAADPDTRVSALPLVGARERREIVESWSRSGDPEPRYDCLHRLFEAQADRVPDAVAVEMGDEALTYAELDRRANRLAATLRARGVGPDARVGLCVERSPKMVVAMLAILKAGGAYVPLDPGYPAERLAFLLRDSGARVLVAGDGLAERFGAFGGEVVLVNGSTEYEVRSTEQQDSDPSSRTSYSVLRTVSPEHLAYVTYTSGSTGEPKGTEVPHRAFPGFFDGVGYARFDEGEVLLQHSSVSWDAMTLELWPALLTGGRCVLYDGTTPELPRMAQTIRRHGVTTLWLPAALFNVVVDGMPELLEGVRQLVVGGEVVSPAHARRALEAFPQLRLVNGYGPSECTVFSTCWPVSAGFEGHAVPIGRPIGDRRVYVLDAALEPVPAGVPGELYVGGPAVARGYLGQPSLTAERFVPDPFGGASGARLYRSGDRVRWRPDGALEFMGRVDRQVKVRGFRVETGEVEAVLARHPAVREAAVVARDDAAGVKRLVAYLVPDGALEPDAVREHARAALPEYMVPSALVVLDALPLTRNGKLDRRALPAPAWETDGRFVAPRTPDEEILAGIWAEVLGTERVGAHDDFFALGGHSLAATRVLSRVAKTLGTEVQLRVLFEAPTLGGFAARVAAARVHDAGAELPAVAQVAREGALPLSFAQERLWFVEQLLPGGSTYAMASRVRLSGALDAEALRRALEEIVGRHEALRTVFVATDGRPEQVVLPAEPLALEPEDLSALPEEERAAELDRRVRETALAPFDLERGPLFRVRLMRLTADEHLLFVGMHHVVSDGWSLGVLFGEMAALYGAYSCGGESPLAPLPVQYADYAAWQRAWLAGEPLERQLGWWRERLEGAPRVLELPTDGPRPPVQSGRGALHGVALPPTLSDGLRALARREGATLFMALLAGFQALLAKYSGQEDLLVGTPVAGRTRPELEGLIGFFVNTLALRGRLDGDPTFRALLARTREETLGAFAHQDLPFERLVDALAPERDLGRNPLFQVVFSLQSAERGTPEPAGLRMQVQEEETHTAKFDLTLSLVDAADGLSGSLEYATDLFEAATAGRMARHLTVLLAGIAADPNARLSDLTLLDDAERRQVLEEWSGAPVSVGTEVWMPVHERVLARAAETPHAVAVVSGGERVTYGELACRSAELAERLLGLGAGPETRVALLAGRSPELVAAMLAVLRAGAAYLPIDPATPAERVGVILADAAVLVVLADAGLTEKLEGFGGEVVVLDTPHPPAPSPTRGEGEQDGVWVRHSAGPRTPLPPAPSPARGEGENDSVGKAGAVSHSRTFALSHSPSPDSAAYVIYTSGSTGTPKGVVVTHGGLANLVDWHLDAFGVTAADRATQLAGLGFDASVWETWPYLAAGATLHLVEDEEVRTSPEALGALLLDRGITLAFVPTPLAEAMLGLEWPRDTELRAVLTGGDALRARPATDAPFELVNNYGPTENTVVATSGTVAPHRGGRAPTIGRPIRGVRAYVLEAGLRPVPAGVPGELCLGGASVARGYLGRPGLTAAAFVPDALSGEPGARAYRTGDRVRWLPGGELEFLGRIDRQAKVRGFRIEPGEVEAALLAHPGVRNAAVVVRADAAGAARLVGYVAAAEGERPSDDGLRAWLAARLPEYMVPSALVFLEALPLTPSGKTDRAALPAPELAPEDGSAAPRTPAEEVLAGVWSTLLGRDRVGARDNFFALGGHSLLATQVISRVRQLFGVELPLAAIFEAPTVERLAARIEAARGAGESEDAVPLRPVERTGPIPASFAQERLWFLEQMRPGEATYAIPAALRMSGLLDVETLRRALEEIVRRHEALRTVFARSGGRPEQVVRPAERLGLSVEEVAAGESPEAALRARMQEEAQRLFALEEGPLFRVALLRLGTDEHALLLSMHHIVSDGWSMGVLLRELAALYAAFLADGPSPLAELPVQYADFAAWQRAWLQGEALERQVAFWRERLAGAPAVLELPTDHPRPAVQGSRGAVHSFTLPLATADAARELGRREGVTLFMTLASAWALLLSRYSGAEDLVVGVPTAGRTRRELEELIGFFVNALPLRAELGGDPSTRELLARTREAVLAGYAHQDVPFEKLVEELRVERSLAHSPIFQVMFTLMDAPLTVPELPGLAVRAMEGQTGTAKFDLTLGVLNAEDGLRAELEYATDLFDRAGAERLGERFRALLEGMIADPARPVSGVSFLAEDEREQVLRGWAGARTEVALDRLAHQLVAAHAEHRPDAVALVDGAAALTWAELAERAHRLANHLRRRGVGPETRVAVCMERGAEAVVAQLGVLAAGAAYVPLDPAYPAERIAYVVGDAGAPLLLTQARLLGRLAELPLETLALDVAWPRIEAQESAAAPETGVWAGNLAYVIYTSGSTGRPKGVLVTHAGLLNLVGWHAREFGDGPGDRMTQLAGPGFDATVWETWPFLAAGAELHVVPEEVRAAPAALRDWLLEGGITVAFLPTPLAEAALALEWPADAPLRTLHTGGDTLHLRPRPGLPFALVNDYGPTECTVIAAAGTVEPADGSARVPGIGRPVDNLAAYVLDAAMQPVPPGVPGELFLSGASLARGYLGRPDLTAEKWLPDPFSEVPGARMYRTADRVRWRADGELEFMERVDRQVKVRGFRIETGEVEAVMAEHPGVREAVVEVRGEARERRLVGYVVAAPDAPLDAAELRRHLGERLPDYMVPSALVFLEALPVTPNGKTDRAALPEPRREADDHAEPRNEVEDAVAAVWREVLGLERVGVHDNFFELGGHSLLLAQVHERLRETLALQIPIVDLFRFPTVAALAEHLGADAAAGRRSTQGRGGERAAARRALARGRGRGRNG